MSVELKHRGDNRCLVFNLTREQFGLVNWAQRLNGGMGIDRFTRRALFEAVKEAITESAKRNRLPPGVAKDFDLWRHELL